MNLHIIKVIIICLIGAVLSCANSSKEVNFDADYQKQVPVPVTYAQGFKIDTVAGGFQHISIYDISNNQKVGNYILVPFGVQYIPGDNEVIIQTPIQDVGILSSSYIGFLDALDLTSSISIIENHNYIYNPDIAKQYAEGHTLEVGSNGQINLEKLVMNAPQIIFTSVYNGGLSDNLKKAKNAWVAVLQCSEWQESHPLARAEWIKLFGALTDQEQLADSLFHEVEVNYLAISEKCKKATQQPSVLFSSMYQDIWYVPGGQSYVAKILVDVNATYAWSENDQTGSLQLSFETVASKSLQNDVWINPEVNSIGELLSRDARYENFTENIALGIYQHNARVTPAGGNDYWESGVVHPDWVLQDFGKMIHPQLFENATFTYFKKL